MNATVCAAVDHGDKEGGQDQGARNATDGEEKAEMLGEQGNGEFEKRGKATVEGSLGHSAACRAAGHARPRGGSVLERKSVHWRLIFSVIRINGYG
jgi:hypothetical protein